MSPSRTCRWVNDGNRSRRRNSSSADASVICVPVKALYWPFAARPYRRSVRRLRWRDGRGLFDRSARTDLGKGGTRVSDAPPGRCSGVRHEGRSINSPRWNGFTRPPSHTTSTSDLFRDRALQGWPLVGGPDRHHQHRTRDGHSLNDRAVVVDGVRWIDFRPTCPWARSDRRTSATASSSASLADRPCPGRRPTRNELVRRTGRGAC